VTAIATATTNVKGGTKAIGGETENEGRASPNLEVTDESEAVMLVAIALAAEVAVVELEVFETVIRVVPAVVEGVDLRNQPRLFGSALIARRQGVGTGSTDTEKQRRYSSSTSWQQPIPHLDYI
jgi:hypothetical protein